MPEKLTIESFLPLTDILPLVDVRSPKEFTEGHIPGAVNIPLFSDDERAAVGIRYKQGGNENAVLLGLEIVGPKLAGFAKEAKRLASKKEILVHCWRGGMRSASMAWLFETAGLKARTLDGGYKAYRRFIRQQFSREAKMIVLGGYTGSGKTDVLKVLEKSGEQFLDIEGIAKHKGSAFGHLGQEPQPGNEQFENNLADAWRKFDFKRTIWVEDESRMLGRCGIPDPLFQKMRNSVLLKIIVPKAEREKRLVKEYGELEPEGLLQSLKKIEQRLGGLATKQAREALELGNVKKVAGIILFYYDKSYHHGNESRNPKNIIEIDVEKDEPVKTAEMLRELVSSFKIKT
ncbi:MAG: tRNA 2-selenouridine(34) synthase MnmH [Bacteroidales bacterium]|nr:tRNA 2-selenouridine(34) synthase MnmH [Bacteroidales bacterium]